MKREFKGTPGPWKWNGAAGIIGLNDVRCANTFVKGEIELEYTEQNANAHLISAAPELLKACEKLIAGIDAHADKEIKSRFKYHILNINSAIAKAYGETP